VRETNHLPALDFTYRLASRKLVDNTIDGDRGLEGEGKGIVSLALNSQ